MAFFQGKRLFIYRKTANTMKSNEIAEDFRISSFSTKRIADQGDIIKKKEGESRIFPASRPAEGFMKNLGSSLREIYDGIRDD